MIRGREGYCSETILHKTGASTGIEDRGVVYLRMPERSSKQERESGDTNERAASMVEQATSDCQSEAPAEDTQTSDGKHPAAVALGRLGASKGGKAGAEKLSKEQRAEMARKAAIARWGRKRPPA